MRFGFHGMIAILACLKNGFRTLLKNKARGTLFSLRSLKQEKRLIRVSFGFYGTIAILACLKNCFETLLSNKARELGDV